MEADLSAARSADIRQAVTASWRARQAGSEASEFRLVLALLAIGLLLRRIWLRIIRFAREQSAAQQPGNEHVRAKR